jgi:TolA-binding protein
MDARTQTLQSLTEKLIDRVNVTETELQALRNGAQNSANSNQTNIDKIARMVDQVRAQEEKSDKDLAAALEALSVNLTTLNNRLGEQLNASLNNKTDDLGKKLNQSVGGIQIQIDALADQITKLAQQKTVTPQPSAEQLLREANADVLGGLYELALDEFQEIVTRFPNHPVAVKAELSRGEVYYKQSNWRGAIDAYDSVLQKYKDQDSKRTALYKKGLALANQKQNEPAIAVFNQVVEYFPDTLEAIDAQEQIKRLTPPPPPPTPPAPTTTPNPARGGTRGSTPPRG